MSAQTHASDIDVALRVLRGLEIGRSKALAALRARTAMRAAMIIALANVDAASGRPPRGRAGRISRKLGGQLSERTVKRFLDRLLGLSDRGADGGGNINGGFDHAS